MKVTAYTYSKDGNETTHPICDVSYDEQGNVLCVESSIDGRNLWPELNDWQKDAIMDRIQLQMPRNPK